MSDDATAAEAVRTLLFDALVEHAGRRKLYGYDLADALISALAEHGYGVVRDDLLLFADGYVVQATRYDAHQFCLADLYAEDCQWAQAALTAAGCWPRGSFKEPADA